MADRLDTTPLDVSELKPCTCCGKGVMHAGSLVFYELTMRSCVVDVKNVQRMHGLEMTTGGAVPLARIFSPSNTVAQRLPATRHLICSDCAVRATMPIVFIDAAEADEAPFR
jgi:hypothetical protein